MKFKDVMGLVLVAFLIVFFGSVFSVYLVHSLHVIERDIYPAISVLVALFVMSLLTSMCFLLLYSRAQLSPRQVVIRYIAGTFIALTISYAIISQRGWMRGAPSQGLLPIVITVVVLSIVGTVLVISVKRRNDNMRIETMEQERELYYVQLKLMRDSLEQQKSIRHDIRLHLAMVKKYLLTGQEGDAVKYLEKVLEELEVKNYIESKNIAFDSVVNYKLSEAKKDVEIEANVAVPQEVKMDVMDIVIIMGNLLENALEAVERVVEKKIKIDVFFDRGNLFINIKNTFDGEVKLNNHSTEEIKIISRKGGRNHGYGLRNVKKSVEKYNGKMEISYDMQFFDVNVLVYLPFKDGESENRLLMKEEDI